MPAMPLKLVRLIAVLVALVVPLQGMAALAASQCMALGHHDAAAMGQGVQDSHADHGHEGAAHEHDQESQPGDSSSPHCGPCTACCASATMSGPAPLAIVPEVFGAPYLFAAQHFVRLAPDELDRPPLSL